MPPIRRTALAFLIVASAACTLHAAAASQGDRIARIENGLREAVEALTGHELRDEDTQDVVDAALFWWRDEDGDLVDALVDAKTNLADGGVIWLLTPKSGRNGHVEPSEIEESAPTAGLHATSTISACPDWTGTRLATPRTGRR